jgi:serine protease DegS
LFKQVLKFITWPAIAGILAAVIILQWYGPTGIRQFRASQTHTVGIASYAPAVDRAVPSVVNIYTSKRVPSRRHPLFDDPFFRRFFRDNDIRRERIQRSLGSGVIVSEEGLILTNRHVIADADEILVALHDGRETLASVVGSDADTDLAVLKVEIEKIQPITLGNPDRARVGDVVLAIGNPYGFGHSVSQGIISALGRYGLNLSTYEDFIQTDAAINQGNSGGALIDVEGRLLGINTAIYSQVSESNGIGLTIPSDLAMSVMEDLRSYGKVIRGWMGLEVQQMFQPGDRTPLTLRVSATYPDGPADKAGILPGDIITHIDMQAVRDGHVTMQQIASLRPGDAIEIGLERGLESLSVMAIVGVRPEAQ